MDYGMHRMLGDRSSPGWILLGPFRDVLAGGLWFSAFFSQNVEWRGRTLRITRGSRLVPVDEAPERFGEVIVLPVSRAWKPRAGRIYNFPVRRVVEEK
ncbi:MAG: hypothetical protein Q7J17_09215 [Candidatus Deferrimicrobium sp.]|nr:hypothetical protein [Candidatus Deferrimicrobium sp.]